MTTRTDPTMLISRVRRTLNNAISDENYYLVHQLYMSLHSRYVSIHNKDAALKTLHEGVMFLLNKNQISTATDLSQEFAKFLLKQLITPNDDIFDYVGDIFTKFGQAYASEREAMLKIVKTWTVVMCPEFPHGHPSLHTRIGHVYWTELNYSSAQYHYLRSSDGYGFAVMLVELHRARGFKHEVDLFIAQVVLQGLCVSNKIIAQSTFQSYTKLHPAIKAINGEPPYILPLLNFLCFLLKILDSGKLKTYIILCEQYQSSLTRDPSYTEYLDKIGQLFFNVKPIERRSRQPNGFFGNLVSILMGDCDRDEEPRPSSSRPMDVEPLD